ncbi:MAG TPA: uroporphyrinogen decarboxylase family protein [Sedimentisphaerales bacterium]|nr:uroporphyrinogen decarboxylase family protein [Sedimentisphaerales bacterium]
MNSRQRVISAFERKGYDRIPVKHEATPEINQMIMSHFGLKNNEQLLRVLGDDFRYIEPIYIGPELKTFPDSSIEGYFGERYKYAQFQGGKYLEASYLPFAGIRKLKDLDRSHFPKADWFDYSTIKQQCKNFNGQYAICAGSAGDMDFINSIARTRGMEEVLMDLIDGNEVYLEIMQARFDFYYNTHKYMLEAADGLIDFMHVGDDLGTQLGPMISMDIFEKYFVPKYKKYFEMVHSFGSRTMMHMCGCVHDFLPRLIEIGLDVYDVVQPTTQAMQIENLKKFVGDKIVFQGSMCVQSTLAWGTPRQVEDDVEKRLKLFPKGGLFLGPTHAIQVGSPLENILAMYRKAASLTENITDEILSIQDNTNNEKINLSKLF